MNTEIMRSRDELTIESVLAGMDRLNALEASSLRKTVDFVELQFAPSAPDMLAADGVAMHLLKTGVGVRLSVHWPFKGTRRWALQTDRTRLVNDGV